MDRLFKRAATVFSHYKSSALNDIALIDRNDIQGDHLIKAWADFLKRKCKTESDFRKFLIAVRELVAFSDSDRKEINGIISYLPFSENTVTGQVNTADLSAYLKGLVSTSIYSLYHTDTQHHVEEIEKHFKTMVTAGQVVFSANYHLYAGNDFPETERQHLVGADIILIFFCSNLINSRHDHLIEITQTYYKVKKVIPVYADFCSWNEIVFSATENKRFGDLVYLPNKKPLLPISAYAVKQEIYHHISDEIKSVIKIKNDT